MRTFIRIHGLLERSAANGPGERAVLWVQGCTLNCPQCFNPETHAASGTTVPVDEFAQRIASLKGIEGLTVTGGEPLQQRLAVIELLERLRAETNLSVVLMTGFSIEEIIRFPEAERLFRSVDVVVAGRYQHSTRLARGLRGSANKTLAFCTGRYTEADFDDIPTCEILIGHAGEVVVTGIDPFTATSARQ